jgi:hypothetical protein
VLLIAALGQDGVFHRRSWKGLALLALWLAWGSLRIHPHYLAYFNEAVGSPKNGRFWVSDSNLDWGQDLKLLKKYLEQHGLQKVHLSYFGGVDPARYGIAFKPFPPSLNPDDPTFSPLNPPPGVYILSVTHLTGQTLYRYFQSNPLDWFTHREPCDHIGYSLLVYCVPPDPNPPQWLAVCTAPDFPLKDEQTRQLLGRLDLNIRHFDCRSTWIVPDASTPGWFLLPNNPNLLPLDHLPGRWEVEFAQSTYEGEPVYTLYRYSPTVSSTGSLNGIEPLEDPCRCLKTDGFLPTVEH